MWGSFSKKREIVGFRRITGGPPFTWLQGPLRVVNLSAIDFIHSLSQCHDLFHATCSSFF